MRPDRRRPLLPDPHLRDAPRRATRCAGRPSRRSTGAPETWEEYAYADILAWQQEHPGEPEIAKPLRVKVVIGGRSAEILQRDNVEKGESTTSLPKPRGSLVWRGPPGGMRARRRNLLFLPRHVPRSFRAGRNKYNPCIAASITVTDADQRTKKKISQSPITGSRPGLRGRADEQHDGGHDDPTHVDSGAREPRSLGKPGRGAECRRDRSSSGSSDKHPDNDMGRATHDFGGVPTIGTGHVGQSSPRDTRTDRRRGVVHGPDWDADRHQMPRRSDEAVGS